MKYNSEIFLIILFIIQLLGCSNVEKKIIGKWQVQAVEIKGLEVIANDLAKSYQVSDKDYNNFIKQTIADLEKNYKKQIIETIIEFTPDYKFDPDYNKPDDIVEWKYDKKQKRIVIKSSNVDIYYYIEKIDGKKMKAQMTSQSNRLIIYLELVKM